MTRSSGALSGKNQVFRQQLPLLKAAGAGRAGNGGLLVISTDTGGNQTRQTVTRSPK